jgi:hypothetical protein
MDKKIVLTVAERQRASRSKRKSETFESFEPKQINIMLSAQARQALDMLIYKSDKSQKELIEELLIDAYQKHKQKLPE